MQRKVIVQPSTSEDTVKTAQTHLREAGTPCKIKEVVADKGYRGEEALDSLQNESLVRTYIPEADRKTNCTWTDKSARRASHPTAEIVATRLVLAVAGYNFRGVNDWSDRSHPCVILVAVGGLGFAVLKTFTSDICQRRWHTILGASYVH